ncbi:MAG: hypothetical protein A2149_03345 [Candidatus Schekmanbacteria bacterium RBG_16_38_11]|uniref:Uncharacterized protein n=1 Tax=Candidatus Schekmanbacteria bacterium RBG_16_38_11 TaxID=1817880 RepID=A0A1F7S1B8_9BACT|nr:MAG: hypothetical protein A2149_03345 [Candidatus Schekmanbacteria bacterium RBG_16_38_11]
MFERAALFNFHLGWVGWAGVPLCLKGCGIAGSFPFSSTLTFGIREAAFLLLDHQARVREVIINITAATVVSLPKKDVGPAEPKRVWLAPPKAAPISAPLPVCNRTIKIKMTHINTWIKTKTGNISYSPLLSISHFYLKKFAKKDSMSLLVRVSSVKN